MKTIHLPPNFNPNYMRKMMFRQLAMVALVLTQLATLSFAQGSRPSPAANAKGKIGDVTITVDYSSPSVKGRKIWGELVPYDQVWRTGANEATVIKFDKDVLVEGKKLAAGSYALFTIPTESKEWTVIFSKNPKQFGAFSYKESEDALRIKTKATIAPTLKEQMLIKVDKKGAKDGVITLFWENLVIPIKVKQA